MFILTNCVTSTSSRAVDHVCIHQPITVNDTKTDEPMTALCHCLHILQMDENEVIRNITFNGIKFVKTVIFRLIKTIKICPLREKSDTSSIGENYGIYQLINCKYCD